MSDSPRRVVVLRSSRFVATSIDAVRRRWPEADLRVLYQAGAEAELRQVGIEPEDCLRLPAGSHLSLRSLVHFKAFRVLRTWAPDAVVLQWWRMHGGGHEAATRAALLLAPRKVFAVLPDGGWRSASIGGCIRMTLARAGRLVVASGLVAACAAVGLLTMPAHAAAVRRESRRMRRMGVPCE